MWPQALQMTRDECRGILRRLGMLSIRRVLYIFALMKKWHCSAIKECFTNYEWHNYE